jgi:hypothetical protein
MKKIQKIIETVFPGFITNKLRAIVLFIERVQNKNLSTKEVFTQIYTKGKWGKTKQKLYFSGLGSTLEYIITPYVNYITNFLSDYPHKPIIVDLGCGDFEIGKNFVPYCSKYIGVDIVDNLIDRNKTVYSKKDQIEFMCLDIIRDNLPDGEICFLRQVLQHLSNEQILLILKKLNKYQITFITEHYPLDDPNIFPNVDKVQGEFIRAYLNSGVYLDKNPFNIQSNRLLPILEVPGSTLGGNIHPGVIRTYMYLSGNKETDTVLLTDRN